MLMARNALDWDDLRVFFEVVRQGSVHGAAKRLNLDHSTVGRRIDRLEAQFGAKLFDRTRGGVVLREEAGHLIEHIRSMEFHASALMEAVTKGGDDPVEVVRIATMEGLASRFVARRIPALARFGETLRIELVSVPQMVDLLRKEADIVLSFFDPRQPGLTSKQVGEVSLFVHSSPRYREAYGVPASKEDLRNHRFVSYIDELLVIDAVRWLDDVIKDANVVFWSNSVIAQCNAAMAGVGLALLPTFVTAEIDGFDRVLEDEVTVRRPIWLSVRKEQMYTNRIKQTIRFLETIFVEDADFLSGKRRRLD